MAKSDILTIEEIINKANKFLSEDDISFLWKSYEFAKEAHKNQFRKSGEPYIVHPVQVAGILVGLEMDAETIAGGFLHDVLEDTDITFEELDNVFNHEV